MIIHDIMENYPRACAATLALGLWIAWRLHLIAQEKRPREINKSMLKRLYSIIRKRK